MPLKNGGPPISNHFHLEFGYKEANQGTMAARPLPTDVIVITDIVVPNEIEAEPLIGLTV